MLSQESNFLILLPLLPVLLSNNLLLGQILPLSCQTPRAFSLDGRSCALGVFRKRNQKRKTRRFTRGEPVIEFNNRMSVGVWSDAVRWVGSHMQEPREIVEEGLADRPRPQVATRLYPPWLALCLWRVSLPHLQWVWMGEVLEMEGQARRRQVWNSNLLITPTDREHLLAVISKYKNIMVPMTVIFMPKVPLS